jgi:antitoxin component YwqK of YwqJK toxin-antitoxin module
MNPNDPNTNPLPTTKPLRHIIEYHHNSTIKRWEYDLNENDQLHGLYERWHDNGQLWVRCTFQNGLLHGLYERWHDNGQLWIRCYYRNGKFE